jgi:hypothetical protein
MRVTGGVLLLLLFSFVLAHSAFPHHHHFTQTIHSHNHEHNHHEHEDEQDHNVFSFIQIDTIFLNGKQITVPFILICLPTFLETFSVIVNDDTDEELFERDILRPPLIAVVKHALRGPPIL